MKPNILILSLIVLFLVLIISCKKNNPVSPDEPTILQLSQTHEPNSLKTTIVGVSTENYSTSSVSVNVTGSVISIVSDKIKIKMPTDSVVSGKTFATTSPSTEISFYNGTSTYYSKNSVPCSGGLIKIKDYNSKNIIGTFSGTVALFSFTTGCNYYTLSNGQFTVNY